MTFREAADILSRHNKWRKGEEGAEPVNPTKVGIAIDLAVDVLECEALMHERCFGKEEKKAKWEGYAHEFEMFYTKGVYNSANVAKSALNAAISAAKHFQQKEKSHNDTQRTH